MEQRGKHLFPGQNTQHFLLLNSAESQNFEVFWFSKTKNLQNYTEHFKVQGFVQAK